LRCSFSFGQIDPPETIRECSLERAMAVHHGCRNREDLHQEARVATSTATASVRFLTPRTSIALDQPAIGLWWEAAISRIQDAISSIGRSGNFTAKFPQHAQLSQPR
jgi:hypothetical protein